MNKFLGVNVFNRNQDLLENEPTFILI